MLKLTFEFVVLSTGNGHAARMLTPGPIKSGFRIPGFARLGPIEEREATAGVDESPTTVPLNKTVAAGVALTSVVGRT